MCVCVSSVFLPFYLLTFSSIHVFLFVFSAHPYPSVLFDLLVFHHSTLPIHTFTSPTAADVRYAHVQPDVSFLLAATIQLLNAASFPHGHYPSVWKKRHLDSELVTLARSSQLTVTQCRDAFVEPVVMLLLQARGRRHSVLTTR